VRLRRAASIAEFGATSAVLKDLNGDRKVDLSIAVSAKVSNGPTVSDGDDLSHISVYPGDGTGLFPSHKVYSVGAQPQHLLAADLNGDGRSDLVAGDALSSDISVLYNDGYGEFQGAPIAASAKASGMVSVDFNHDGLPDVAVVNTPGCTAPCGGTVTVMLGTGKPYLGAGVKYAIGMHGAAIATGDVTGDGIADLVVTNNTSGDDYDLSVLLGNENGTFKAAMNEHLGALSADAVLADVNGDQKLDLVTNAGVALGKGDGTFGALIPFPDLTNSVITHVAVADFNHDGHLDVAASTTNTPGVIGGGDAVAILKGNGTGSFTYLSTAYPQISEADAITITALTAGDLNKDGYPDIAAAGAFMQCCVQSTGYIAVMFNRGDGTFNNFADDYSNFYQMAAPNVAPGAAIAIGDLNGDGLPDVTMAGPGSWNTSGPFFSDTVSVLLNNGKGGPVFVSGFNMGGSFLATSGPSPSMVVTDFNNDGANDIAVSSQLGVSLLFNAGVVSLSPPSLSWAKVMIGQTGTPKTITVTNNGSLPLALHATVGGAEAREFRIYANTCNATITAGASCSVTIAFRPTATGTQDATLAISQPGDFGAILATAFLEGIGAP